MQGLLFDAAPEAKPAVPGWPCVFSPEREMRYLLWRVWSNHDAPKYLAVIGLNPSTADEIDDDPTIRRCIGFAKSWGLDALAMLNLFAFRETSPEAMKWHSDPVGDLNDKWIVDIAIDAEIVLAAWGCHGAHLRRDEQVRVLLCSMGKPLHMLKLNKDCTPLHPLYAPGDLQPIEWARELVFGSDCK